MKKGLFVLLVLVCFSLTNKAQDSGGICKCFVEGNTRPNENPTGGIFRHTNSYYVNGGSGYIIDKEVITDNCQVVVVGCTGKCEVKFHFKKRRPNREWRTFTYPGECRLYIGEQHSEKSNSKKENQNFEVTVFPNPVRLGDELNIFTNEMSNIILMDLSGKILNVTYNVIGNTRISTFDLSRGIYNIKITEEQSGITNFEKLVIH